MSSERWLASGPATQQPLSSTDRAITRRADHRPAHPESAEMAPGDIPRRRSSVRRPSVAADRLGPMTMSQAAKPGGPFVSIAVPPGVLRETAPAHRTTRPSEPRFHRRWTHQVGDLQCYDWASRLIAFAQLRESRALDVAGSRLASRARGTRPLPPSGSNAIHGQCLCPSRAATKRDVECCDVSHGGG